MAPLYYYVTDSEYYVTIAEDNTYVKAETGALRHREQSYFFSKYNKDLVRPNKPIIHNEI